MSAATDSSNYTGFLEMDAGLPAIESFKSSLTPFGPLKNITRTIKSTDRTTNQPVIIVDCWAPSQTLAAAGVGVVGAGYANLQPGSKVWCANGVAIKTGAAGTDTWLSILGS